MTGSPSSVSSSAYLKKIETRFRAYKLGEPGASYSYFADNIFTLIEARRTEALSHRSLRIEMEICNKTSIDTLHITSWDVDHCKPADLIWILENLRPNRIEYPGYAPHHGTAEDCLKIIREYKKQKANGEMIAKKICIDPEYIASLDHGEDLGYRDILYHPRQLYQNESNNNSTVKLFRTGSFNVASMGDVEHPNIGSYLRRSKIFKDETDILVLPHHGADSDIMTKNFVDTVKPTVAICNSNFDNQYDHPTKTIQNLLANARIKLLTTKRGDVLIQSIGSHVGMYRVTNLISDSTTVEDSWEYESKKRSILSKNADSINNRYNPGFKGIKRS